MAGKKVQSGLLITGEELGGNGGDGHHLGSAEAGLSVVAMADGLQELIEKAVDRDNFFWHSRRSAEFGVGSHTLSESLLCPLLAPARVATWVN